MNVTYPEMFWFLLAGVPLVIVFVIEFFRGRRELPIVGGTADPDSTRVVWLVKWFFSGLSFLLAVLLGVLSLAGFTWGTEPVQETRSGLEVGIVLDVSRSMLATDVQPSRLERASVVIQGLTRELRHSRFSLTIFKGAAVKLVPMTEDTAVFESVLSAVGPAMVTTPGTELAEGLETALDSFPTGSDRNRLILLFSDGEYFERSPLRAAGMAGDQGIPIVSVGAGTAGGAEIELSDGTLVRDIDGRVVVTRVNTDVFEQIAAASGGSVYTLSDADILSRLIDEIRGFEEVRTTQGFRLVEVRRYRLFLALSLVFLLLSHAIRTVRWKRAF